MLVIAGFPTVGVSYYELNLEPRPALMLVSCQIVSYCRRNFNYINFTANCLLFRTFMNITFSAIYIFRFNWNRLSSFRVSICPCLRAYLYDICDARSNISLCDLSRLNSSLYLLFSRYVAHILYSRMYFVA
jgi:hypothetical protein